jgi:putative DNA primase/helicase
MTDQTTALLDAALAYAARGWHVFPCHTPTGIGCSCHNKACADIGKHPRTTHGFKDATTDEATIRRWWRQWPDANVAIATGGLSGLVVLDKDTYKGGDLSLRELEQSYRPLPETVLALTGGGGEQPFFAHPGGSVPSSVAKLGPGLDVRADGGYVIAPPSLHRSGKRYLWEASSEPGDVPLAPLPDWVLALCQTTRPRDTLRADVPIPDHERNETLFRLGASMRAKGFGEAAIFAALWATNCAQCQPPITEGEVRKIAASDCRYAPGPLGADLLQSRNGTPPAPNAAGEAPSAHEPTLPLSDYTNALAFVRDHHADVRYLEAWGKWLHWTGTHWDYEVQGPIMQRAKATIKRLLRHCATLEGEALAQWMKHIKASLNRGKLEAMVTLAQDEPRVTIRLAALNTHPWLLPCANGTLDLVTGELREAQRRDYLTACLTTAYDPRATCPVFEAFLWRIMGGAVMNEEADALTGQEWQRFEAQNARARRLVDFLQRVLGQCLSGDVSEQDLYILYGTGANGKSTLINLLLALLGPYAMKASGELLMTTRSDRHPTERADLYGKRLVATIETQEAGRLNESFVKEATGADWIRARRMREDFWQFLPTHKLLLASNHKPEIRGMDYAIWRRIKLIPFSVAIPEAEQDKALGVTLAQELPGILAWLVRGCRDWHHHGLHPPEEVLVATEAYRQEQDVFAAFLETECFRLPSARVSAAALYQAYERWCGTNDLEPIPKRAFGIRLGDCGFTPDQGTGGRREWVGIGLPAAPEMQARQGG